MKFVVLIGRIVMFHILKWNLQKDLKVLIVEWKGLKIDFFVAWMFFLILWTIMKTVFKTREKYKFTNTEYYIKYFVQFFCEKIWNTLRSCKW